MASGDKRLRYKCESYFHDSFSCFLVGHHLAVTIFRTPKVHHTHIVTLLPAPRCLLSNVAMNIGNNLTSSEYSACETVAGMPIVTEKFCLWVLLRPSQLVLNRHFTNKRVVSVIVWLHQLSSFSEQPRLDHFRFARDLYTIGGTRRYHLARLQG